MTAVDDKDQEELTGAIERVVYHNPENGYFVARILRPAKKDVDTITGNLTTLSEGESIIASGRWVMDKKYGMQFQSSSCQTRPPSNLDGITRYLSSGMIDGIGKVYAKKLIKAFGEDIFHVMENEPHLLSKVDGIGKKRAKSIVDSWQEQKSIKDIMVFLYEHNISSSRAVSIYKRYGEESINVIKSDPYRLAKDIRGIGFAIADKIALSLGIEKDSIVRAKGGVRHVLLEAAEAGSCGISAQDLITKTSALLEQEADLIRRAIDAEITDGEVVHEIIEDVDFIFLKKLADAENQIATLLKELMASPAQWRGASVDDPLEEFQRRGNIKLSQGQIDAARLAAQSKLMVITGGPGSGKTTLLKAILYMLSRTKIKITLAAPTGRAARRLSEATGRQASTIHRLLGKNLYSSDFYSSQKIDTDLLVLDEASMVDVPLMLSLMQQLPPSAGLFMVGDIDQLPSVGPGCVLGDMISSGVIPVARLSTIFRQQGDSAIITNCYLVNKGEMPVLENSKDRLDFYFMPSDDPEYISRLIVELIKDRLPGKFGMKLADMQVLCPMTRGLLGTHFLNELMQKQINPNHASAVEIHGKKFAAGDKVMQIENNYEKDVFNGDSGFIESIDMSNNMLSVNFEGDRLVHYEFRELDELTLAYAITIHKSQGSEYGAVIIPLTYSHFPMLQKNLLYTAISRGKKLVILIGQKQAVGAAVRTLPGSKRYSLLKSKLQALDQERQV